MDADTAKDSATTDHGKWAVVLLVDDQAIVAEGIRRMIADETDIRFHYCADPKKAVHEAIACKATVILQDLVMPEVDGLTLVRFYRNNPGTRDVPIIVLSSKDAPHIKSDAFDQGATDYLVKKNALWFCPIQRTQAHWRWRKRSLPLSPG